LSITEVRLMSYADGVGREPYPIIFWNVVLRILAEICQGFGVTCCQQVSYQLRNHEQFLLLSKLTLQGD